MTMSTDIQIELDPSTVSKVRERLVGRVAHVRLRHVENSDGRDRSGMVASVSSKIPCFSGSRHQNGRVASEPYSLLVLTAETVEVRPLTHICSLPCMRLAKGMHRSSHPRMHTGVHGAGGDQLEP